MKRFDKIAAQYNGEIAEIFNNKSHVSFFDLCLSSDELLESN